MLRSTLATAFVWLVMSTPAAVVAQDLPAPPIRAVHITGAKEIAPQAIEDALRVKIGEPLVDTPERLAESVTRQYQREGYTFARVKATFDAESGDLALDIDEGSIDKVEFQGIDEKLARTFAEDYAVRAGDVFNRQRARQALDVLLRQTRGAVSPTRVRRGLTSDNDDVSTRHGTFDMVDRNGERTLLIGLREPPGRFRMLPDPGEREDWFSSVDGFVPSLGMGIAVFDHDRFNHTFVAGHLSYKFASERAGYALGFERPLFGATKLYVGGELHDLTASDDRWQASSLEASLAALGPGSSLRDYYRRRGLQITAALRVHPQIELLAAWRDERQEPLRQTTDFSFWDGDDAFRPNTAARDGRLNALLLGASFAGRGFERESLAATYRRHQFDTLYGERLDDFDNKRDLAPMWRVDWTSELSQPDAFGSDFDFRRHIVSARTRVPLSEHQTFGARAIGGWSDGVLPPQRQFAVGGFGSVHGYDFKTQIGDSLALLNLEYELGWRGGLKAIGFFDAGRAGGDAPVLKGVGWGVGIGDFRVDVGYRTDAIPSSSRVTLRFGRTF